MSLILQFLIGGIMIGITVMIHAVALDHIIKYAASLEKKLYRIIRPLWKPLMASIIVLNVFVVHISQIWLWAFLYLSVGAAPLESFSDALYFSSVTYTTLGYGDIVLEPSFRMLSAIEGTNGILLFGWTTAFIFEVITQLYKRESREL